MAREIPKAVLARPARIFSHHPCRIRNQAFCWARLSKLNAQAIGPLAAVNNCSTAAEPSPRLPASPPIAVSARLTNTAP